MTQPQSAPEGTAVLRIELARIHPSPDNPRKHFDEAFLAELGRSLREAGQFTPCTVRPHPKKAGEYELAAGESRYRAAKAEGLPALDCFVKPLDDAQFLELLTFENLKRRDLRPLEEARSYALLQKKLEGWTVEKIAQKSGVSPGYVRDRMRLLQLIPAIQDFLEADPPRITLSHAVEIAKLTAVQQATLADPTEWDGLWRDDDHVERDLFDSRKKDPLNGRSVVSVSELKAVIGERFAVDVQAEATAELFPDLVSAMRAATERAEPVVHVTDQFQAPDVEKGAPRILTRREWRRADGTKGAKACKHAVLLVGVGGGVRGQAFKGCIASTECRTHFKEEVEQEERRKQFKAQQATASAAKPQESSWEREARLKREAIKALRPALPKVLEVLAAKVAAANAKPTGPLATLLLHGRRAPKPEAKKAFPDDVFRQLAFDELVTNATSEWQFDRFRADVKALGVDLKALVKQHGEKATKKASPKKKVAPVKSKGRAA